MMDSADENRLAKLEKLHEAALMVSAAHDVQQALQVIANAARELVGAEMSAIGVPGKHGEPMAHFVVSGLSPEVVENAGRPPMGRGVLGILLKQGQPLRLDNLALHEAYEGLPGKHPPITSFLGVPISVGGEVIGDLYIANKIAEDSFSDSDQQIVEMLASHTAVVIQTLRYHQKQEEVAIVRAYAQLAPKIQDDVLQTLYGAGLLLRGLDTGESGEQSAQIEDIQSLLDRAILNLRQHLNQMAASPNRL